MDQLASLNTRAGVSVTRVVATKCKRRTWRPSVLTAIVVASKIVYDEKVYLADYREQLSEFSLVSAPKQESAFLGLCGYSTTVRRGQYAKYYYALEDVARTEWSSSTSGAASSSTSSRLSDE